MNLRRKRMMLMDGQWYGYLRTASGNPLTLQAAKRLRKLTIYGNAVQDGTPSPDAPVEVQLCGDRTGNLWDRAYSDVDANWVGNRGEYKYLNLKLKENTTYTLFVKQNNMHHGYSDYWDSDDNLVAFYVGENPNTWKGNTAFGNTTNNNPKQVYSFTTTEAPYYFNLFIRNYNDRTVKQVFDELLPGIMLVQGSYTADTLPAYEPYGYKVSGRAEGLNLFDKENASIVKGAVMKTTLEFIGESDGAYSYMRCDPNTTYTINKLPQSGIVCTANQIPATGAVANSRISAAEEGMELSLITVTTGNDDTYLWIALIPSTGGKYTAEEMLDSLQVLKGTYTASTIPPYEPYQTPQDFAVYLPEQIAKVGDVADEMVVDMEAKTAELRKNVGSVVVSDRLASSATGSKGDDIALFYKLFPDRFIANSETVSVMSDKLVGLSLSDYKNSSSKDMLSLAGNNTNTAVFMKLSKTDIGGDTAESANTWIADNRITVYYVLATPVTTDITSLQQWDAMPQVSGTVTLTLSAEVDPSGAEAVYYSKERGE